MKRKKRARGASSKQNQKRWVLKLKLAALFVFLCAASAGIYYFTHSKAFELREIEFSGNKRLSSSRLRSMVASEGGDNLLFLSSADVADKLLASPWVKEVRVRKEFMHTLLVMVQEAEPVAFLRKGKGMFFIDSDGAVLEKLQGQPEPFLPVVVCDDPSRHPDAYREAVHLARVVRDSGLSKEKKLVEIVGVSGGAKNLSVRMDGLVVKIGEGEYREKLARLFELSGEIKKRSKSVEYVDLRFANRVVVKPVAEVLR